MYRDIPSFMAKLRQEGELVQIDAEVDPNLEIAEVHRRVIAAGGPALLFTNPKGYDIPVVTNLFGTQRRVEMAFGPKPLAFVENAVRLVKEIMPPTLGKLWGERLLLTDVQAIANGGVDAGRGDLAR